MISDPGPFRPPPRRSVIGRLRPAAGGLLLGTTLLAGVALANVILLDSQGYNWDIYSSVGYGGYIGDGTSDAFDSWPYLCVTTVDNTAACATSEVYLASSETTEDSGREAVMGAAAIRGLQVSRKVYISNASATSVGFARYLEILTNSSASPITVTVRVGTVGGNGSGDLGSDGSTVITSTSAGGTTVSNGLYWIASDDSTDGGGDPSLGHVLGGPNATQAVGRIVQRSYGDGDPDNLTWEYASVTVPAGGQRILMHFQTQQPNRTASSARAAELDGIPSYALTGLSTAEQAAIVNFRLVQLPVANAGGPYSGAEGSAIAMTGAASTAPSGTLTRYEWDCASDGTYEISSSAPTASCTYTRYGTYTAKLRVTDSLSQTATATAAVTVSNVAPVINTVDVSGDLTETGNVTLAVSSLSHPGTGDTLTYSWSFSDGQTATGSSVTRTFPDNGTYSYTVTVRDTGNLSGSKSGQVVIANRNPSVAGITLPTGLNEGASGVVTADATDPAGSADPLTYTWSWGDGTPNSTVSQASTTHAWPDNGTFTVTVTVSDGDGGTATSSGTVTVGNLNPVITSFNTTLSGLEGSSFAYSATATDAGTDPLTYTWDFGDGATATGASVTHIYTTQGSYTLTLTVSDGDGGTAVRTATVTVSNASPSIGSATIPVAGGEGEVLTFSVSASDPGNDPLDIQWVFGDGATGSGSTVTHAYADQGSFNVTVYVMDDSGAGTAQSGQVVVSNVNPTISSLDGTFSGAQGQTLSFSAVAADPGLDTLTYRWDFGDGSAAVVGVDRTSTSHAYTQIGTYTLTLTVSDEDGGSATASRSVSIGNSGPAIADISGDQSGDEGELLTFQVVATDPGGDPLTYTWDFGDGSPVETGSALTEIDHVYMDDDTYTITITVADPSAATASATLNVTVRNVAPTVTPVPANQTVAQAQLASFVSGASDPGADVVTLSWDFGDGSAPVEGNEVSHAWFSAGVYTVTITATDDDGASASESFSVTVSNLPPELASIVGPSSLNEGGSGTWSVVATDASGQPVSLLWEFGDGGSASGAQVSHTYADDGSYTLRVTGTDANGDTDVAELAVTVANLNPVLSQVVIPTSGVQGEVLSFSVTASDVPADPLSYRWNFGDGAQANTASATFSWSRPGTYPVSITVTDDTTGSVVQTGSVVIANVDPVIDGFVAASTGEEGSPVTVSFSASDASGAEPTATLNWGDGSSESVEEGVELSHTYADNGLYSITLSVADADAAVVTSTAQINIANANPSIGDLQGTPYGQEGDVFSYFATVTDPAGAADVLTYAWDFGDGKQESGVDLTSVAHKYLVAGQYTLTLTVSDEDGGSTFRSLSVNVGTAAPYISKALADTTGSEGDSFVFSVEGADPTDQALTYGFDFGDGQTATQDTGEITHTYDDDGIFGVTVTVTDPDALTAQATFEVEVADIAPSFLNEPPQTATEGILYSYDASAAAAPADIVSVELLSAPDGASLDVSNLLTWTPTLAQAQVGTATFELRATDDDGSSYEMSILVQVSIQDLDGDGMADSWEAACGLDPANPEDGSGDADGDGRSNFDEYQAGTSACTSNLPDAPLIVSPEDGAEVAELQPAIAVEFTVPTLASTDPIPAGLQVELELYRDEALTDGVEVLSSAELSVKAPAPDAEGPQPLVLQATLTPSQPLTDNADLFARARAKDAYASGPWSEISGWFVNSANDAPGLPSLSYPADGAALGSTSVTFQVGNASDVDRDALTLSFRLADAEAPETWLVEATGVEQDPSGMTSWTPEVTLESKRTYLWQAQATDVWGLSGEWTEAYTFTLLLENHAPTAPVIVSPEDEDEVTENPPTFVLDPSVDVDGDAVAYTLELATAPSFQGKTLSVGCEVEADSSVVCTPTDLLEENTVWYARAQATDGEAISEWSAVISFTMNSENEAPSAPTLQNPADGAKLTTLSVSFTVINAVDPEGDALTYTVVASGPDGAEVRIENVEEDASGVTTLTGDLTATGTWTWTAFATDSFGLAGSEASANTLVIEGDDPVDTPTPSDTETPIPPPDSGSGCACSQPDSSPLPSAGTLLVGLFGLLGLTRRRRASQV